MKKIIWIPALVALWLILIISRVPAQWGIALAGTPLLMDGVSGTIWSGRAANVVLPYQDQSYALGQLRWTLSPWSLLGLNPCVKLSTQLQNQNLSGSACASLSGDMEFSNVDVNLPAAVAELWLPVNIRGDLFFHVDQLKMNQENIAKLQGKGSWENARYHNSQDWINLGTIAFDFSEDGNGGVKADVFDIEGPLQLQLDYQFTMQGTYDLKGDVALRPNAPQEIGQLLMIVADEKGPGRFAIEWAGS